MYGTETFTAYKVTNERFSISNMAQQTLNQYLAFQISCIEGLESLITLEVLDLSDNNISRIRNLKTLTRLKKVNLSANYIGSIECLTELTDVSNVYYNGKQPV
jgi:Leucine-rich repeat (LRR) protein